jgi:hypothetical protein
MRSEKEIKTEARAIVEQIKKTKDKNLAAYRRLSQRLEALAWVLNLPNAKARLVYSEDELEILEALE